MKLTHHELLLYTDDDYRENVLKSEAGRESAQDILEDSESKLKEVKKNGQ